MVRPTVSTAAREEIAVASMFAWIGWRTSKTTNRLRNLLRYVTNGGGRRGLSPRLQAEDADRLLRRDPGDADRLAEPDDRVDRPAGDRDRPGRARPVLMGGHRIPARVDGDGAALRQALGHLRAPAPLHDRDARVLGRL